MFSPRTMLAGAALFAACVLTGCSTADWAKKSPEQSTFARYTVTGSRIARTTDARGQPRTGAHVVTISDDDLQRASGMLLSEKLGNGFPTAAGR